MTHLRPRSLILLGVGLAALGWSGPARANLILSFDNPSPVIASVGGTTTLGVYVSEVAGNLPMISATNPLLTGGVQLTFATTGAAIVTGFTANPIWDDSSPGATISGSNTVEALTTLSLSGIADLSQPLLLGSFTFTGKSIGSTSVLLSTIRPGVNFIDLNGDNLDPTNTPTALIRVGSSVSVPEPTSMALAVLGGACGLAWLGLRRSCFPPPPVNYDRS